MADEDRTLAPPDDGAPGDAPKWLGPYRLLRRIGEGGFGEVWEAEQTHPIQRRVAIKLIRPGMDSRDLLARFDAERQALALMDHPHIARVFDAGTGDRGTPYFAMELVHGTPLTAFCDAHRLPLADRLALFEQVCQAVQHAHGKGVIHRDLKPGNVLVSMEDGEPFARVIDFGIARAVEGALGDRTRYTLEQQLIGTPPYMSPEQAAGSLDIDTRSDIYALGTMLYELITGTTPLAALSAREAALAELQRVIRDVDPPRPSALLARDPETLRAAGQRCATDSRTLGRQVRGELDWIVMKALEKERARRYDSAGEFSRDVRRYLEGAPVLAAPPSARYRVGKFVRRNRLLVASAAAIVVSLVGGLAVAAWQARIATQRADQLQEVTQFQAAILDRLEPDQLGRILDDAVREQRAPPVPIAGAAPPGDAPTAAAGDAAASPHAESFDEGWARLDKVDVAATFLDHAVLAPAADAAKARYADQPRVEARLVDALAGSYVRLGRYEQGLALRERQRARSLAAGDREDVIGASIRIAELQRLLGDYASGEASLRALRDQCTAELGDHRYCPDAVEQLADLYLDQDRHEDAERAYRDRAALLAASRVATADDRASATHDVGYALMEQGKLDEAETWLRRAREQTVAVHGEASGDVADVDKTLATVDLRRGRFAEAEATYRRVLAVRTAASGGDHPWTGSAANDVAVALFQQGRTADAVPFMEQAVATFAASYGPLHMETLIGTNNVCILLVSLDRVDEAMPHCLRATEGFRTLFGDAHSHTLMATMGLAGAEIRAGRPDAARARLADGLPLARDAFAEETPIVLARWLLNLAKAELALGDRAAAAPHVAEGAALVAAAEGANDIDRRRVAEIEASLRGETPTAGADAVAAPR